MGSIIIDGWKVEDYFDRMKTKQRFVINPTLVSAIYEQFEHFPSAEDERYGCNKLTKIIIAPGEAILTFADMDGIVNLMAEKHCITDCRKTEK